METKKKRSNVIFNITKKLKDLPTINSLELEPLQGEYKDLGKAEFKKLKAAILDSFKYPIFVWHDEIEEINYIIDGHQRHRVIMDTWPGGVNVPVVYIDAGDINEAKLNLLQVDSDFGKRSQEGFDAFIATIEEVHEGRTREFIESFTSYDTMLHDDSNYTDQDEKQSDQKEEKKKELPKIFAIEVACENEKEQEILFDRLCDEGYTCKVLTL